MKIKLETLLEERERRKKIYEASNTLQQLSTLKLECQSLNKISFELYAQLLVALKCNRLIKKFRKWMGKVHGSRHL